MNSIINDIVWTISPSNVITILEKITVLVLHPIETLYPLWMGKFRRYCRRTMHIPDLPPWDSVSVPIRMKSLRRTKFSHCTSRIITCHAIWSCASPRFVEQFFGRTTNKIIVSENVNLRSRSIKVLISKGIMKHDFCSSKNMLSKVYVSVLPRPGKVPVKVTCLAPRGLNRG